MREGKKSFLISLGLHLSLLSIFLFSSDPPPAPHLEVPMDLSLEEIPATSTDSLINRGNHSKPTKKSQVFAHAKALTFKDLLPKFETSSSGPVASVAKSKKAQVDQWMAAENYATDDMNDYSGMDMAQIRFSQALWREMDRFIFDSPYLSEYNHAGKIYVRFQIDGDGRIDESRLRACGEDRVLKVLALRALRKALKNETGELHFPKGTGEFNSQFSWSSYEVCKSLRGIHQNNLSFCHYAENKMKTFSTDEKIGTYLGSLQYGFGAIEEIQKYKREEKHRRRQFDPFEELERDPDWDLGC